MPLIVLWKSSVDSFEYSIRGTFSAITFQAFIGTIFMYL